MGTGYGTNYRFLFWGIRNVPKSSMVMVAHFCEKHNWALLIGELNEHLKSTGGGISSQKRGRAFPGNRNALHLHCGGVLLEIKLYRTPSKCI